MLVKVHRSQIANEMVSYCFPEVCTISEAVARLEPLEPDLKGSPYIAVLDGRITLRSDWDKAIGTNLEILVYPMAVTALLVVSLIISVASLAVSAYLIMTNHTNTATTSSLPAAKDVFSFSGQSNAKKLNEPVETSYGLNLWYPPFYTLPCIKFSNNMATMEIWLSLGTGSIDVSQVLIGGTDIESLANCFYEVAPVGYTPSSVQGDPFDLVYMGDKTNSDLKAPDDSTYEVIFTKVNPPGTLVTKLQANIAFNSGLYAVSGSSYAAQAIQIEIGYRQIDYYGNPTTGWTTADKTFSALSTTPQRFTLEFDVPSGRYEMSFRRITASVTSGANATTLVSAYGKGYSGLASKVNLLRVSLLGSNAIGSDSATKIQVRTQRKLATIVNGAWTDPVPTRNPIWAILDSLTSDDGGRMDKSSLDLAYWEDLASKVFETFDTVLSSTTTVWAFCQSVCTVIKGAMFAVGSDLRVAIDSPSSIPVAMFTVDNASDLSLEMIFRSTLTNDSVKAVYVDPDTGLQTSVNFTPPGSEGTNPQTLTLTGVTDRNLAWRLAAYAYQQISLVLDKVTFSTGLDGLIPLYGDVISVQWPFPEWASAGEIIGRQDAGVANTLTLVLSDPIPEVDPDNPQLYISIRMPTGEVMGPMKCARTSVSVDNLIDIDLTKYPYANVFSDAIYDGILSTSLIYAIGGSSSFTKLFKVTSLQLMESNKVSVEAQTYDPAMFVYDSLDAPAPGQDEIPYPMISGYVSWMRFTRDNSGFIKLVFPPIYGASSFKVWYAYDTDNTNIECDSIIGFTAFIPSQTGILHVTIIAYKPDGSTVPNLWKGSVVAVSSSTPLETANSESQAIKLTILNAVLDSGIVPSQVDWNAETQNTANITSLVMSGVALTGTGLKLKVDLSLAGKTKFTLTHAGKSISAYIDDRGYLTFTKSMMDAGGLLYASGDWTLTADTNKSFTGTLVSKDSIGTIAVSSIATSVGYDGGFGEYWSSKLPLSAIKKYFTISASIPAYPDSITKFTLHAPSIYTGDQLANYCLAAGDVEVTSTSNQIVLQYMTKLTTTIKSFAITQLEGQNVLNIEVYSGMFKEQPYPAITGALLGFLDANGNNILPDNPNDVFAGSVGDTNTTILFVCSGLNEYNAPIDRLPSAAEMQRIQDRAVKMYRLDIAATSSNQVNITAKSITTYGSESDSGLITIANA